MADTNYRRLEDKIDRIFDQLSLIQQNIVELKTERISTCKEIDLQKSEITMIKETVDEIKEDMDKLNLKVAVISAGITVAVSIIFMVANWLLGKQ